MGRRPRVEYAGALYHVMCRGNRRESIFEDERDCELFLELLAEACARTGWSVCAYVLMPNHYHMIIQTPEANLVTGMKWFQGTYTKRHNFRHKQWGHVFQGRYKSVVIDSSDSTYFRTACNYVHLNPVRSTLVGTVDTPPLREYPWSSSRYLSLPLSKTPEWLSLERIVEESTFQLDRSSMVGEPRRMHDETEAERLLSIAVRVVGLELAEKDSLRKNDSRKELIAWFLSKRTSVGQGWISNRLGMGDSSNVSHAIRRVEQTQKQEVKQWKHQLAETP
jgi:REP element-mobilizing transposase RayT